MSSHTIVGRVGRDPELRFSANGVATCRFSLAVSRGKKVNGEWEDVTTWFDVTCFKENAENAAESIAKGDEVICEGYIEEPRTFEKKDGTTGVSLPFIANAIGPTLRWGPVKRAASQAPRQASKAASQPTYSDEPF